MRARLSSGLGDWGRWEPYEARVSRTVLRGPGGKLPRATHYADKTTGASANTAAVDCVLQWH
jgi:hypothetical protein